MELVRRAELLKTFHVLGSFYKVQTEGEIFNCRSQAKLIRKGVQTDDLDAIFVLVNPGGCKPSDAIPTITILDLH